MEERSICPLPMAKADTENDINSSPKQSSVSDADTVINTYNTNSSQLEGDPGEEQTLRSLLTDDHCHVCDAVLLFESQRVSHYEGKKHAQKLRLYLQAKKEEKRNKESQVCVPMDKNRMCELCNMVFSSPVVASSHYRGKVHAKNLRKQALNPASRQGLNPASRQGLNPASNPTGFSNQKVAQTTLPLPTQAASPADPQISEGNEDSEDPDPCAPAEADRSDPNKHCSLCKASFNNPHMAMQHYNGRKHQRNHSRQQLLQHLGEDRMKGNSLTCLVCSIKLNSVEMYQAHMQGNKHQIREKKVLDLCKSQKKVYNSFTDELADYVQVQKARGLTPKTRVGSTRGQGPTQGEEQDEGVEDGGGRGNLTQSEDPEPCTRTPNLPPSLHPLCPPHPAAFYPPSSWHPHYQAAPTDRNTQGWGPPFHHLPPQSLVPGLTSSRLHGHPPARKRARESSSSSSSYTSSSPSSYTSSSDSDSDSDSSEYRDRRRGRGKSRTETGRRDVRDEEEEEKRRRRKQGVRIRDDSEGRKGRRNDEEEERGRKSRKRQSKSYRHGERPSGKRRREDSGERDGGRSIEKQEIVEENVGPAEQTLVHVQSETAVHKDSSEEREQNKAKHRKDKRKRQEETLDTRTEEEKLWDESILGL